MGNGSAAAAIPTQMAAAAAAAATSDASFLNHFAAAAAAAAAAASIQTPQQPTSSTSFHQSLLSGTQHQYPIAESGKTGDSSPAKSYTKKDMERALEALQSRQMSLSKAAEAHGIPATTLWQRANRMGIAVVGANSGVKSSNGASREAVAVSTGSSSTASTSPVAAPPPNKNWSEEDLNSALEALRKKEISANKAAKVCKIKKIIKDEEC